MKVMQRSLKAWGKTCLHKKRFLQAIANSLCQLHQSRHILYRRDNEVDDRHSQHNGRHS
jgi:hypothetical protein